jgi:hypothetical protein
MSSVHRCSSQLRAIGRTKYRLSQYSHATSQLALDGAFVQPKAARCFAL